MNRAQTDSLIQDIMSQYSRYAEGDSSTILKAYEYAIKSHEGYLRKSGEPYIVHPVGALKELIVIEPDLTTVIATLLHDSISNGDWSLSEIESLFWREVRGMVEALDKIGMVKYRGDEWTIERLQRTFLAMAQDVRTIFVKFADRIDNLRTLQHHRDPKKAKRIAEESLSIYAPIAARLGLYSFKETMETLALRELDLDWFLHVAGELAHYTLEQEQFLTSSVEKIKLLLPEKYRNSVSYRVKKPYSIYRKLKQSRVESIRDIYDVFALRIIVDDVSDCYGVLGIIHGNMTPISERFKDFIAVPKTNWYQSLHTTVLGFETYKQPIEIQIRTTQMDHHAERGTSSHILYKLHGDMMQKQDAFSDLVQTTMDTLLSQWSLLWQKISFPTMFAFSPKGDVFELPNKSTPIDFAYAVHSDVGYHAIWARVNGRIATLDSVLHNADVVEIITSQSAHPVEWWLDFVVSSKAKSHIGIEVKRLSGDRERIITRGEQILRESFKAAGITLDDNLSNFSQYYGSVFDDKKKKELLYNIGQWIRKPWSFLPYKWRQKTTKKSESTLPVHVIIWGQKDIPHQLAQCCSPKYPQDIVAVLRTWWKCMIHSLDCSNMNRINPKRILSAYWQTGEKGRVISFSLLFHNVPGVLSRVVSIFYEMEVNIIDLSLVSNSDGTCCIHVSLETLDDESFLDRMLTRMRLCIPEYLGRNEDFFDKKK